LQSTPPPPGTTLLSSHEAKERLREIVEGFFFRHDDVQGQPPARHMLVRSPPGLGKTKEAMEWATRYRTEQAAKTSILDLYRDDINAQADFDRIKPIVEKMDRRLGLRLQG
jgi:hypothetical protein